MRREQDQLVDGVGHDSFLDVIANMVGIVIILVVIVGIRSSRAPVDLPLAAIDGARQELTQAAARSEAIAADIHQLGEQSQFMQRDIEARKLEREHLTGLLGAVEQGLEERRNALDQVGRADFDLRRGFAESRAELERLLRARADAQAAQQTTIKIQNLPTPISKTVLGKEVHVQLQGGRVTWIALDELLKEFRASAQHKVWKLEAEGQMTDTVGPIGGFRLRYRLGRFEIPPEVQRETGRIGSVVRLVKWELIPVAANLGETIDAALGEGSEFRSMLATLDHKTTITVWTYPDSFGEFRKLKAELHTLGYPTASRPLPAGVPIGGSPEGSHSAAQ